MMDIDDQRNLSEELQPFHGLQYSVLDMPYQGAGTPLLLKQRAITACTCSTLSLYLWPSETPGDAFVAALVKQTQTTAACAGEKRASHSQGTKELLSLLGSPTVSDAIDLFPFLVCRWWGQYRQLESDPRSAYKYLSASTSRWH